MLHGVLLRGEQRAVGTEGDARDGHSERGDVASVQHAEIGAKAETAEFDGQTKLFLCLFHFGGVDSRYLHEALLDAMVERACGLRHEPAGQDAHEEVEEGQPTRAKE